MSEITIKKVLIANRAEIALRVIRTCLKHGIETVTLYTREEENLPQRFASDESVFLEGASLKETYLNADLIIKIAKDTGCDAIHPGYGFLSENADFSKKVSQAGLIFIGPSPESIILMGDKKGSKEKMIELGVPTIPGYHGENQDADFLKQKASEVGYPVLIKASAGGGGKGMRIVYKESEFLESLESCKREALSSFSSDIVLIEKFIENPRHIEVQVMSDNHGNHFHFFERECSIQRRHQKVVEEAPSIALSDELRDKMTSTSTHITSSINYSGAGTVEYILDGDKFYFLEMNTRLQVEHPVTEMITGFDLVECQLIAASNQEFSFDQDDIEILGHSIELRIYAEDPDSDFLPAIGRLEYIGERDFSECRLECGYNDGNEITVNFDPMIAKLVSVGEDRDEAISNSIDSLKALPFAGLKTNIEFLIRILNSEPYLEGDTYTHFIQTHKKHLQKQDPSSREIVAAIAMLLPESRTFSPWAEFSNFRLGEDSKKWKFLLNDEVIEVLVDDHFTTYFKVHLDGQWYRVQLADDYDYVKSFVVDGELITVSLYENYLSVNTKSINLTHNQPSRVGSDLSNSGNMLSPMPGKILKLCVNEGELVDAGNPLVIMEAMKMEHTIKASSNGKLVKYLVAEGELIQGGIELFEYEQG